METKFAWQRPHPLSSESTAAISWTVPDGTRPGTYRLRHFADSKGMLGGISPFSGTSGQTRECVFAILLQHSGSQQGHRSGRCCVFYETLSESAHSRQHLWLQGTSGWESRRRQRAARPLRLCGGAVGRATVQAGCCGG